MVEDITRVDFEIPLNYSELMSLFKYLVLNLDSQSQIQLHTESSTDIGSRNLPKPECLDDVVTKESITRVGGIIRRLDLINSVRFSVKRSYENEMDWYTGIQFEITPGYKPGELGSDDIGIINDTKRIIGKYFSFRPVKRVLDQD